MGNVKFEKNKAQTGASRALGLNFDICFPVAEVSMLASSIVPYIGRRKDSWKGNDTLLKAGNCF